MAFVRVDGWSAPATPIRTPLFPTSFAKRLGWDVAVVGPAGRRLGALIASALIHSLLLYLLATRLLGDGSGLIAGSGKSITLIDLPGLEQDQSDEKQPSAPRHDRDPTAQEPASPKVEEPAPPATVLPEWKLVRVRVARASQAVAAQASPTVSTSASNAVAPTAPSGGGGGQRGGGNYDPYAGAAPTRLSNSPTFGDIFHVAAPPSSPSNSEGPLMLDAAVLEVVRRGVLEVDLRATGMVEAVLRVAPNGEVLAVRIKGGTLRGKYHGVVKRMLIGQRLFRATAPVNSPQLKILRLVIS